MSSWIRIRVGRLPGNRGRPHTYVHAYTVECTYVRIFVFGCLGGGDVGGGDVGSRDATGLIVTIDA